ncbi:MAG: glycosyltransferase family 4 protein [Gemmatimonadota bacterium]
MRVLQIVQRPQRRGAEIFAYDLARRFEALGIAVCTVYLYRFEGRHGLPLHETDVCLDGADNHVFEKYPGIHPALLRRLLDAIGKFQPGIVQVNGSRTVKYGAAARHALGSRASWKLVYRNIGVPSSWHRSKWKVWIYRNGIMSQMDGVIGVSSFSLSDARSLYGLRAPWTVIPNGINPARIPIVVSSSEVRRTHGAAGDDMILIFVGRLERAKRADRFVRVLARVGDTIPGTRGWIVGDGPLRRDIERLAHECGVSDRTCFLGATDDVASLMNAADLLVVTSDTEGIPATVLEAGFLGVPVVATGVGGLPECIVDGETGILAEDEEGLVDAIVRLAGDGELRATMARRARERTLKSFLIDRVADSYVEFYARLLDEPRCAAA